jgi:hypothetical protein
MAEDIFNIDGAVPPADDQTISVDDAANEIGALVNSAVNFIDEQFMPGWESAQKYYDGLTDIQTVKGRSQVVMTAVRDAIRSARPSLLRIFLQADTIVEFVPNGTKSANLAAQQSKFVNSLFFRSNGYQALYDCIQNAMLKKLGVMKFWFNDSTEVKYYDLTALPTEEIDRISAQPDAMLLSVTPSAAQPIAISPDGTAIQLFDAEVAIYVQGGKICVENVPLEEFFIDENASNIETARVVGHRRQMRVGDAVAMGLPFDELDGLDTIDVELYAGAGESEYRRGYMKVTEQESIDRMMRLVLITECYARYDLDGTGIPQLYRFWLGGTAYELLHHERASQVPFGLVSIDPEPNTVFGKSVYDVTRQEQDTMTSLLRATVDNAHLSNNRRLAVHDTLVNMDDVLNPAVGAPIRVKSAGQIQEIGVQSTISSMLPLLQFLKQDTEQKVGVTGAAMGIDHDALQSTTREAAMNTIQMSQGQIEVMARNIAEGLKNVFNGLLKLSMWHMPRQQVMEVNGDYVPVDTAMFDSSLYMRANVGLGTGEATEKLAGLQGVLAQQKEIVATLGPSNPIVTYRNIYNTLEDMTKLYGIYNVSRYFSPVTPEVEQVLAQQAQQAAQNQQPVVDPGTALIEAEKIKAQLKERELYVTSMLEERRLALDNQIRALEFAAKDDLERDKMAQDLEIAASKSAIDKQRIKLEQDKVRMAPYDTPVPEPITPPPAPATPAEATQSANTIPPAGVMTNG